MTKEEQERISEFISHAPSTIAVSVDGNGYPRPVPVFKVKSDGFNVWFGTRKISEKMRDFCNDPKAGMCFISGHETVALRGDVEIIEDNEAKNDLWLPVFERMFPDGPTDPNVVFLKFSGKEATTFIGGKLDHFIL